MRQSRSTLRPLSSCSISGMMSLRPVLRFVTSAALLAAGVNRVGEAASKLPMATAGRTGASLPNAGDRARNGPTDIALDDDQVLRGRFVDSVGGPIDGAVVTLRQ